MSKSSLNKMFSYDSGHLYWLVHRPNACLDISKPAGSTRPEGYQSIYVEGKPHMSHRLIWVYHNDEIPEGLVVDHINRNKADNNIENLRLVTQSENLYNQPHQGNSTGLPKNVMPYVTLNEETRYRVRVTQDKVRHGKAGFLSIEDASCYAKQLRNELHKEFACHA